MPWSPWLNHLHSPCPRCSGSQEKWVGWLFLLFLSGPQEGFTLREWRCRWGLCMLARFNWSVCCLWAGSFLFLLAAKYIRVYLQEKEIFTNIVWVRSLTGRSAAKYLAGSLSFKVWRCPVVISVAWQVVRDGSGSPVFHCRQGLPATHDQLIRVPLYILYLMNPEVYVVTSGALKPSRSCE